MLPRSVLTLFITASILCTVTAQQPQSTPPMPANPQKSGPPVVDAQDVVRITTSLVQVDVSVTKDGKPVTDLQPEDFEIFEDGKPQTITNFSYVSNMPGRAPTPAVVKSKDKISAPVPPAKINLNDQRRTNPQRIRALHPLKVGKEMEPGNYVLQIIVTDLSDKKPRVASRWIDFEVVK